MWFDYGESNDSANAALFAGYLFNQLRHYGVNTSKVIIQTNNGSEFIGSVTRKDKSAFEKTSEHFKIKYGRIPPRACTWNSDVEAFYRMIEDEFYDIEDYRDAQEFIGKAYAYQLNFNFKRRNRWRDRKTPIEILEETSQKIGHLRYLTCHR